MTIELVPYSDLKNLLELEKPQITDYPALNVIRESVTYAIEEYLVRSLESKSRTDEIYINSFPTKMIGLTAIPISSIASFTVTIAGETASYTEHQEYEITNYGVKLLLSLTMAKVDITYTGGITTVPEGIKRAALIQTAYEFQSKEHIGADSVSSAGGIVSRPALSLLGEVKRMLNSHKHPLTRGR